MMQHCFVACCKETVCMDVLRTVQQPAEIEQIQSTKKKIWPCPLIKKALNYELQLLYYLKNCSHMFSLNSTSVCNLNFHKKISN